MTKRIETIEDLIPDDQNANKGTERGQAMLERSLRDYGAGRSILADKDGRIIAGNKTLTEAAALGLPVDVIQSDGTRLVVVQRTDMSLDDEHGRGMAYVDNRASEVGMEWDIQQLVKDREAGAVPDMAFGQKELDEIIRRGGGVVTPGLTDPDDVPAVPDEPITKPGDLWLLGRHRLLCGDATVAADVARLMDGERSRLMPTDPPYLVDYQGGNHPQSWHNKADVKDKHWDDYQEGDGAEFFSKFIEVALAEALTSNPAIYQFHATRRQVLVEEAWIANKLLVHQTIIWFKARPVLTRSHYMWQHEPFFYGWVQGNPPELKPPANATTVWEVNQIGESDGIHPTQKPTELIRRMVEYHTLPDDIVYEPFSGSGTAIIVAEETGRRCNAMDISPAFVDVAVHRFEAFTGISATRIPTALAAD